MKFVNTLNEVADAKKINEKDLPNFYKAGKANNLDPNSKNVYWMLDEVTVKNGEEKQVGMFAYSPERKGQYFQFNDAWYRIPSDFQVVGFELSTVA